MRPVAIVQARESGATRFGGSKVFADIGGLPMLARVIERLRRCKTLTKIVIAIPHTPENDGLAAWCSGAEVAYFRGPEDDVLKRYVLAARKYKADPIVRVTADCPFLDPAVIDATVRLFLESTAHLAANNLERTFMHGLDVEVIAAKALRMADKNASSAFEREHVSEHILRRQETPYKLINLRFPLETAEPLARAVLVGARLTVDYPEDLELARAIYAAFPEGHFITTADIVRLLCDRPDLMQLNEHRAIEHAQALTGHTEPMSEDAVRAWKRERMAEHRATFR